MPRVEIAVEGMTCGHCETSVTAALQAAGATNAVANFRRSYASADFGGNPAVLVDAVREAGYTPGTIDSDAVEEAPSIASDVPGQYDLAVVGSGVPLSPPPSGPPTWAPVS